jgi:hypothetical protein
MNSSLSLRVLLAAILVAGFSSGAYAQATRTWVSGVGDDVNPCSRTAPCKTFAGAISKTATGGEINVLDPGAFGALTITKSISVISHFQAGVLATFGSSGFIVNTTANAEVLLQGLDIEGLGGGANPGAHGVRIISNSRVTIQDCSIRNFAQNGINLAGPVGARVLVQDSIILSNNNGISIAGTPAGSANVAVVLRTTIDNHPGSSITVAAGSTLFLSGSKLFGSAANVTVAAGGTFTSFGDNALQTTGTPTNTIPLR